MKWYIIHLMVTRIIHLQTVHYYTIVILHLLGVTNYYFRTLHVLHLMHYYEFFMEYIGIKNHTWYELLSYPY